MPAPHFGGQPRRCLGGGLGFGDDDSGWAAGARFLADDDFYVAVEGVEEVQEAFDGESVELVIDQGGDFGLIDVEQAGGGGLREAPGLDDLLNGDGEANAGLLFAGVAHSEVGEDVAGTAGYCLMIFAFGQNGFSPGTVLGRAMGIILDLG